MGTILNIPVPKAGKGVTVPIDVDELMELPADTLREILFQGAKNVLNRGQSKLASAKDMEGTQAQAHKEAVLKVVGEQWELCKEGKIRVTGGKAKRSNTAVRTEAMRIAKLMVKDALKRIGEKVSHYPAKEITKAAELYLDGEDGPAIMEQAEAAVKARQKKEEVAKIDLSHIAKDPELVKKAEAKKAKGKKEGEAAQSGIAAAVAATKKGQGFAATKH